MKIYDFLSKKFYIHPYQCWGVTIAITLVAIAILSQASLPANLTESFIPDPELYQAYKDRVAEMGSNTDGLIRFALDEGESLFTVEKLNAVQETAEEIARMPEVVRVFALTDMPNLMPQPDEESGAFWSLVARRRIFNQLRRGVVPDDIPPLPRYWPADPAEQKTIDLAALRAEMLADERIAGDILAENGQAHMLVVQLGENDKRDSYQQYQLLDRIEQVIRKHGLGEKAIYSGGVIVAESWLFREMARSMLLLLPIGAFLISLIVYLIFRRFSLVFVTLFIGGCSTLWGLAATQLIYGQLSVMLGAVPLLVLIISSSNVIHLASAYTVEVDNGASHDEALREMSNDVSGACFQTSLTTALGMITLVVIPVSTLRHFAIASAIGVSVALVLAVLLTPLILGGLPQNLLEKRQNNLISVVLDGVRHFCFRLSSRYPLGIVIGCLLVMAVAGYFSIGKSWEANLIERFPADHPLRTGERFLNQHFSGAQSFEVFLRDDPGQLTSPETLAAIRSFEQQIRQISNVTQTQSVIQLFDVGEKLIGFGTVSDLPESKQQADAFLKMTDRASANGTESMINTETGLTRVIVHVNTTSFIDMHNVAEKVKEIGAKTLPKRIDLEVSGSYVLLGSVTQSVLKSQVESFLLCFVSVSIVLMLGTGSLRLGLLAIPPNLFPLMMLLGLVGLIYPYYDSDIIIIFVAGFGLAVDDTIHFLHRFQLEYPYHTTVKETLGRTFDFTGQAMLRTTVILSLGLAPFALAQYLTIWMLGSLLIFLLFMAIIGDMLLMPALLMLFMPDPKPSQLVVQPQE